MAADGPSVRPPTENAYTQFLDKTHRRHRLLSAHWELTYRCNERCTHCYLDVFAPNAHVPNELTTEECFRIVDELAAMGALNLTFSGGEILTRRDFFEIAQYARRKRFLVRLFTNGILIKPAVADRIAELHPYAVEVSIYGADAETHDRITQISRSFELTTRALRLLHERGVRTVLKTPIMHENAHQLHALQSLAQELGAQFRYDVTITPKNNGGFSPLLHRMSDDDLVAFFHQAFDVEGWAPGPSEPEQRTCNISLNTLVIDPDGNIFPCTQTRISAGNVREQSLKTIWESSAVWQELSNLTLANLPICRTCELRMMCTRCHGVALVEDGDLRMPALTNCREALARRKVLIERGELPTGYPIPAHLQNLEPQSTPAQFISLVSLSGRVPQPAHA